MENMFSKWRHGLEKTSKSTFGRIATVLGATEIDDDTWDDLEAILVQADLGIETTESIIQSLNAVWMKRALSVHPICARPCEMSSFAVLIPPRRWT